MSFSTQKDRSGSDRFMLVRINPSRDVTSLLTLASGTTYQVTMGAPVSSLTRNGTALTKVTALSGNDQWTYNESTQVLQVRLASAPNATTNILILSYYLFVSTGGPGHAYETPTDSATSLRQWDPLITQAPTIKQSVSNLLAGVFTIEASSIELDNSEHWFESYLTDNDSFFDKDVDIWLCIDSTENISKVFKGKTKSVSLSQNGVSINVLDSFSRLLAPAYFGDTAEECYTRLDTYTDLDPRFHDKPIPLIIGKHSRYKSKPYDGLTGAEELDPETMYEAAGIDYDTEIGTIQNREWVACRVLSGGVRTCVLGAPSNVAATSDQLTLTFSLATWATMDLVLGDTFRAGTGPSVLDDPCWCRVVDIAIGATVVVKCAVHPFNWVGGIPVYTAGTIVLTAFPAFSIVVKNSNGAEAHLYYEIDYTISTSTTTGGNKLVEITFVTNFESDYNGVSYTLINAFTGDDGFLNPSKHAVHYRVRPVASADYTHGATMKYICEQAGLDTLDATFTQADTDFDADVLMSVPFFDETDYSDYLKYAQVIAESTLGYMFVNSAGEAEYHLLSAPTPTDIVTEDDFHNGSLSGSVEYQDIVTQIIAYNPHDYADSSGVGAASATVESNRAKYLHGINRTTRLRHVLDTIAARLDEHLAIKSRPAITYTIKTSTRDLETDIGDEIQLSDQQAVGGTSLVDLRVVGVEKSTTDVTVQLAVVEGI